MQPTVLLFDVDGTLLDTGGAGRRAVERAFDLRHGRADACDAISFCGMTDRAIVRDGLAAIGVHATAEAIDALLSIYLVELARELAATSRCRVLDGVEAALNVGTRAGCAVGLGTGNIHEGAMLKLGRVGLADWFAFGGFGSDHELRSELLRVGAQRGAARLAVPLDRCRVVVIGDTPKDVDAAHAIGAECLAVASGRFGVAELVACGPRWTFASLSGAIDAVIHSEPRA